MYIATPEDEFLLNPQLPAYGTRLSNDQCLNLAYRLAFSGVGFVSPNPLVGCVITDQDNHLLGTGAHRRYGAEHAEVEAVRQVVARLGEDAMHGAKVFVTLQPCTHHGKTLPCVDLLTKYQIHSVYYGLDDPNPLVSGTDKLQEAGIECHKYEYRDLNWLNEDFHFHHRSSASEHKRPFVAAKIASSLDGSFAELNSQRMQITNARARQYGHFLRLRYDAIMVGARTLQLDDPRLTVRLPLTKSRNPLKIVLCSAQVLNENLHIITHEPHKTIAVVPEKDTNTIKKSLAAKIEILPLPVSSTDQFDLAVLLKNLHSRYSIYSLLLEGGGKLWSSFFAASLVDKVHLFQAPQVWSTGKRWQDELVGSKKIALANSRLLPLDGNWLVEGLVGRGKK